MIEVLGRIVQRLFFFVFGYGFFPLIGLAVYYGSVRLYIAAFASLGIAILINNWIDWDTSIWRPSRKQ